MEAEVQQQKPVDVRDVYAAITGAFSLETPIRNAAEASLKEWEADAAPGFLAALLNILEHSDDEARSVCSFCALVIQATKSNDMRRSTLQAAIAH